MEENQPLQDSFTAQPGIKVPVPENAEPYHYFCLFFTLQFWQLLCTETNRFAQQYLNAHRDTLPARSRFRKWVDVSVQEMKVFFALFLLMGFIWKPEIDLYWNRNPLIFTPLFPASMKRDRWMCIASFLHFANNEDETARTDKLRKIRPLITFFQDKFQTVYIPYKHISIDEELVPWKGRLDFRQFIPSKRARFGVKIYALCESSGYMSNFFVYVGRDDHAYQPGLVEKVGKSGAVVVHLLDPLFLDKGYNVYIDNFYSSIELAEYLETRKTGVCGTIRKNRRGLPKRLVNLKLKKRGSFAYRTMGSKLFVKLSDTKEVYFLTNLFKPNVIATNKRDRTRKRVHKLNLVHQYNQYMGGVDRNDALLSYYSALRKSMKWYKKIGAHFIEEALLNSYILYKKSKSMPHHEYVISVLSALLADGTGPAAADDVAVANPAPADAAGPVPTTPVVPAAAAAATATPATPATPATARGLVVSSRLGGRKGHYPAPVPASCGKPEGKSQRRCVVCSHNGVRKMVTICCLDCVDMPGLCATPCFRIYHTCEKF